MKKKSLTENFLYNILYQILVTALPILTAPYTARVLGITANGSHSYTESIVTYFIILGYVGTALYGTRRVAYVSDDPDVLKQTTWDIIWLRFILMGIILAVYVPLLCVRENEFTLLYRIQIINIVANGIDLSWFFQGVEDFKKVTLRNMLVKFLYVICLFLFIRSPADLPLYVLLIVGSSFLGNVLMWFYLKDYLGRRSIQRPQEMRTHLLGSIGLFIPQVTNYVYSLLDRSMLKWMTGNTDYVSIYDQGQRLLRAIIALMQSVGYVMMARLSNLKASNEQEQIKTYIHKSINLTLFFAFPIMFGLGGVAKDFIPLFLGEEYLQVITVLQVLCPLVLMISFNSVLGVQLLISVGKERQYTIATTAGALVNIIVNIFLLPSFNILGACISSLAAEMVVLLILYRASKEYVSIKRVLRDNWVPFVTALMMFGIVLSIRLLPVNTVLRLVFEVGAASVFYFIVMIITKNEIMHLIYTKVMGKLRKGKG